jgi:ribosomal protein S18 acetylase RimI-like enzyme
LLLPVKIYGEVSQVDIHYILGGEELLDNIKCLWEKLNGIHREKSIHFKNFYSENTFAARKKLLLAAAQKGQLLIILAYEKDVLIGYCIASLVDEIGEIDSLFVSEKHRKHGIATCLMEKSLNWLKQSNPSKTGLKVSVGNEGVFGFYARHGFFPRLTELQMISAAKLP